MPEWLEIVIRSFIALVYLFILAKLIGKRQIRQLTFMEYVVGITIGSLAAFLATEADGPIHHGILSMTIFGLFPIIAEWLSLKSKVLRNFFGGNATVVIKDGKILEDNLKQERLSTEELMENLRMKNVFKVADVEFAALEQNGEISVLLKGENLPLTPKHIGLKVAPSEEPQAVIMDGVIMDEPLATIGQNRNWLKAELAKAGVALENVFLGQVDKGGQLYLDLYDDKIKVAQPQAMKLTHATLKKCQADLEVYALSTKNATMKKVYESEAKRLQQIIDQVTPLLMR
jgi:uncharacterized membrane protein YcaP (DUF421 family)